ncbi:hypothetical protein FIBSPDRAFT_935119 [Athelia psychrophila]|uniref:Glutamine amidotransferase type-2 domain-containing protein n=1 Tax=Athelia psychrophila TaxID=1759441 RepID=A0A166E9W1_9AGAM|nr:hypothetical protein FIBSPDRAFT_935119 [Fibularhizoctonia sp. CBS 109695]
MCEWFTYLGLEDQLLEDVLLRPSHSIVKQIDSHFLPAEHAFFDPSKHQPSAISPPSLILSSKTKARLCHPASANDTGSPNPLTNMDCFGLGWWTGAYEEFDSDAQGNQASRGITGRARRPPLNDLVLKSLARGVKTRSAVAHVRAGTGLTPVVETNCHPFTYSRHLFCYNGVLGSFHLFRPILLSNLPLRYQMSFLGTRCRSLARTIRSTSPPCTFTT